MMTTGANGDERSGDRAAHDLPLAAGDVDGEAGGGGRRRRREEGAGEREDVEAAGEVDDGAGARAGLPDGDVGDGAGGAEHADTDLAAARERGDAVDEVAPEATSRTCARSALALSRVMMTGGLGLFLEPAGRPLGRRITTGAAAPCWCCSSPDCCLCSSPPLPLLPPLLMVLLLSSTSSCFAIPPDAAAAATSCCCSS